MDRSVIEVGGVRLVSAVMVGDMGSIVFPAARSMVEWMAEQEIQRPGWIKDKNVFGSLKLKEYFSLNILFLRTRVRNWGSWPGCSQDGSQSEAYRS